MTGALKSTPINDMETITELESMGDRREVKQVIQMENMKRLQHHPIRERVTTGTKSRLKRLSFLHKARKGSQDLEIPAQDRPEPMNTTSATPWSMLKKPEIRDSIEEVGTKTQVPMEQLTHLTQKYIEHHFPIGEWIRVYTDGSATEAVRNGGGGVYIEWPDGTSESHAIPTGLFSSNFRAEIAALEEAASILKNRSKTSKYRVVLLTDTQSVLQALTSAKCPLTEQLLAALCQLHSIALTVVHWIPGHSNISENDQADSMAKEGAKLPQIENDLDLPEIKTITKSTIRLRWNKAHPNYSRQDQYHLLTRPEQVTIFRVRTGHNRLRQHMHSKFIAHQAVASANKQLRPQPISCSSLSTSRCNIWDQPISLDKKKNWRGPWTI